MLSEASIERLRLLHREATERTKRQLGLLPVWTWYAAVLLAVAVYLLLGNGAPPASASRHRVQLVTPGKYSPMECADWAFYSGAEAEFMASVTSQMLELSERDGINPLTTAHVRYNFCGLVYNSSLMLNPRLERRGVGAGGHELITSRLLCGELPAGTGYAMSFAPEIKLSWKALDGSPASGEFSREDARRLQIAMAILQGRPVCGPPTANPSI